MLLNLVIRKGQVRICIVITSLRLNQIFLNDVGVKKEMYVKLQEGRFSRQFN